MAAERAILAEMLAMRAILLNFLLKLSMRQPITEQISRELITWGGWPTLAFALSTPTTKVGALPFAGFAKGGRRRCRFLD
jgi:hypothetical protein